MPNLKVSALTTIPVVDRVNDLLYIVDVSAGTSNKTTPNQLLGISGNPVGDIDTQTLSNKTLTAPTINGATLSGTVSGTYTLGGTPTFPATVVTTTGSQTLTNKTLTSPTIITATITNPTLTVDSINEFTSGNGVTVGGLNVKSSKLNTANSVITSNVTDAAITPNKLVAGTGTGWAWQTWTPTFTNFTLGNGSIIYSRYQQIGKRVDYSVKIILGTTSSVSGTITLTPPATPNTRYSTAPFGAIVGLANIDTTGAFFTGKVLVNVNSLLEVWIDTVNATYNTLAGTTSTIPATWGNNFRLWLDGSFEVA